MSGQSGGPSRSICFRRTLISLSFLALKGMQNRCVPQRSVTTPYDHMSKAAWGKSSCLMCNSTSGAMCHIAVIFLSKTKCEAQSAKPKSAIFRVLLGVSNKIFPMDQSRCASSDSPSVLLWQWCVILWNPTLHLRNYRSPCPARMCRACDTSHSSWTGGWREKLQTRAVSLECVALLTFTKARADKTTDGLGTCQGQWRDGRGTCHGHARDGLGTCWGRARAGKGQARDKLRLGTG